MGVGKRVFGVIVSLAAFVWGGKTEKMREALFELCPLTCSIGAEFVISSGCPDSCADVATWDGGFGEKDAKL